MHAESFTGWNLLFQYLEHFFAPEITRLPFYYVPRLLLGAALIFYVVL